MDDAEQDPHLPRGPARCAMALTENIDEPDILARLLYRDALMLVIDKPAGIPVHAGAGGGVNLETAFEALRFGLPRPPALAHRLDRDTSGCLVLGRNRHALATLGKLFAAGRVEKTYWALVEGVPAQREGLIDLPLRKRTPTKSWRMDVAPDGVEARTRYKVIAHDEARAWLALSPLTGRTHQLRVHCAAMGWPIAGDWIYGAGRGERRPAEVALQLHARAVAVPLYPKKPAIVVEAPAPPHMAAALAARGFGG